MAEDVGLEVAAVQCARVLPGGKIMPEAPYWFERYQLLQRHFPAIDMATAFREVVERYIASKEGESIRSHLSYPAPVQVELHMIFLLFGRGDGGSAGVPAHLTPGPGPRSATDAKEPRG